jgi:glycine dehydrogenase subunit 1
MKHRYLPMTEQDKKEMLETIGVSSIDELFSDIPEKVRFQGQYNIKPAKSIPVNSQIIVWNSKIACNSP